MMLVARVIFAFLFLEIYMALKVGINREKQAAVSVIYCVKPAPGEGGVCAVQFLP